MGEENQTRIFEERRRKLAARKEAGSAQLAGFEALTFWVAGQKYAVDLARTLLVVSSRRLETVIGASSAIAGVLPVQGEVAVALRTPALLGLESAPEPQEGFVIFVSRRAAEPETATRIGLWVERLGEVERVEFAGDARPGESPGALRRRYVKSKSNEDCLHIEVDSIFDHPVFRESSKEN